MSELTTRQIELLQHIADSLDKLVEGQNKIAETQERIELVLEEKQNKTSEAKECRELMQQICRYYRETNPPIDIQVGARLQVYRLREAISKIKNIRNTKQETRKLNRWLRRLEEREFLARTTDQTYEVLSTGASWWE
jgi:predicted GTPase